MLNDCCLHCRSPSCACVEEGQRRQRFSALVAEGIGCGGGVFFFSPGRERGESASRDFLGSS